MIAATHDLDSLYDEKTKVTTGSNPSAEAAYSLAQASKATATASPAAVSHGYEEAIAVGDGIYETVASGRFQPRSSSGWLDNFLQTTSSRIVDRVD